MSFWIRRRDKTGKHLWLIDTHPESLLVLIGVFVFAVVLHPALSVKVSLIILLSGGISIVAAKASLIRKGTWTSWGTEGMTVWNARFYKAGYVLISAGVVVLLIAWFATR